MAKPRKDTADSEQGRAVQIGAKALEDLTHWVTTDRKTALKVLRLIESARRTPFGGEGKPEPLKHLGADLWSRRITRSDRLVYRVTSAGIYVIQARFHY